jgi:hypothetical protein
MDVMRGRGTEDHPARTGAPAQDSRTLLPVTPDRALPGPPADHVVGLAGFTDVVAVSARATSQVFRGREPEGEGPVAIKVYTSGIHDAGARAAFERQLGASEQLGLHPNLMIVYRFGIVVTGHPYVVMPWYDRGSLSDELWRRGPMPVADVLRTGAGIAGGLGYAHGFGFVHRAVKPTNVLVSMLGEPVLSDFAVGLPGEPDIARTPAHAAPELWDGEPATAASDVWSLASTLFTALAGHPPFGVGSPPRLGDITLPPLPREDVPPELVAVLQAGLSRCPEDRPAAEELADHLRWIERQTGAGAEGGEDLGAGTDTNPRGMRRPDRVVAPQPVAEVAQPPQSPPPAYPGTEAASVASDAVDVDGDRTGAGAGLSAQEGTPTAPPRRPEIRLEARRATSGADDPAGVPAERPDGWAAASSYPVPATYEVAGGTEPPAPDDGATAAVPGPAGGRRPAYDPLPELTPEHLSVLSPESTAHHTTIEPAGTPREHAARPDRAARPLRPSRPAGSARPAGPARPPRPERPARPPRPVRQPRTAPRPGSRSERWGVDLSTAGAAFGVLAGMTAAVAVVASLATFLTGQSQPPTAPAASAAPSQTSVPIARASAPLVPRAAAKVHVTGATRSTVTLAWDDTNKGRTPYAVIVDTGAAAPVAAQRADGPTSHIVQGLSPATTYCFTVRTGSGAVTPVTMPVCARTAP